MKEKPKAKNILMMKIKVTGNFIFKSLMTLVVALTSFQCCLAQISNITVEKVVIIRHGEKPDKGDHLSCKGYNRSLQLPAVLYAKYKIPDKIFVPSVDNIKSANHLRMFETIIPFAVKYNISINSKFDVDDVNSTADAILKTKGYVLVVWEHDKIDNLAKALGAHPNGIKWNDNDFDSIWIINFKNGKATLSMDRENINPPDNCP
jgi:hypothetical protein